MYKFIKNILVFFIAALIIGEITVRLTHSVSDIPQRIVDKFGIQKYHPNQKGYWKGGEHTWLINKLGWPGELPESYKDLMLIIGDSFIENFMNPNDCHQASYLKDYMPNYNFMEAGRSGVSFIEAMEISAKLDTLRPIRSLIYINDSDFYESISELNEMRDITQLSIKTNSLIPGEMKKPGLKKVLYNWKLMYYFYNRFPLSLDFNLSESEQQNEVNQELSISFKHKNEIFKLMTHISKNYSVTDKVLIFRPDSSEEIIEMCKSFGFVVLKLDSSKDSDWTFGYDGHWTCFGHQKAAGQISSFINTIL